MIHSSEVLSSAQREKPMPTQRVVGFPISTLSFEAHLDTLMRWAQRHLSKVVCVCNVHMLMEGNWQADFAEVLTDADLLTPDGMPLAWMTSLMNRQRQDRVAGMELMQGLCERSQTEKIGIFFLGSTPEMLSKIEQKLGQDYPSLRVAGMVSPPFRALSAKEEKAIVEEINASGAGLVFVSLGCPKQEHWMHRHRGQVQATMVGLGGAFSVYAGEKQWAPAWVRKYGLEWCYRLMQEPRRLWKRYASTIPPFLWLALKQVVKVRLGMNPELAFRQQWARHS